MYLMSTFKVYSSYAFLIHELLDKYLLVNDEWKHDKIPEIMDGKNVADFIDPEIEAKLELLEKEEEKLIEQGYYVSDDEMENEEEKAIREAADIIKAKTHVIISAHQQAKGKNRPTLPKKAIARVRFFSN